MSHHFPSDSLLEGYRASQKCRVGRKVMKESVEDCLDVVKKIYVGRSRIDDYYNQLPEFAKRVCAIMLQKFHSSSAPLWTNNHALTDSQWKRAQAAVETFLIQTKEEYVANEQRRGTPERTNSVVPCHGELEADPVYGKGSRYTYAVAKDVEKALRVHVDETLFEQYKLHDNRRGHESAPYIVAMCTAFFVIKVREGKDLYRQIVDARPANILFKRGVQSYESFTLEEFRQIYANLCSKYDNIFVVWCDIRHAFHQIALPDHLKPFFIFSLDGSLYNARTMPMGWTYAPKVLQSLCLSLALMRLHRVCEPEDLGVDPTVLQLKEIPRFIPLWHKDGKGVCLLVGGIFAVIDNLLVLHKDKRTAYRWKRRFEKAAHVMNIVLKKESRLPGEPTEKNMQLVLGKGYESPNCLETGTKEIPVKVQEGEVLVHCLELKRSCAAQKDCPVVPWIGLELCHSHIRVDINKSKEADPNNPAPPAGFIPISNSSQFRFEGNYKVYSGTISTLLYRRRVQGVKRYSPDFQRFLKFFQVFDALVQEDGGMECSKNWKKMVKNIPSEWLQELVALWSSSHPCHGTWYSVEGCAIDVNLPNTVLTVTDAAFKDRTANCAYMIFGGETTGASMSAPYSFRQWFYKLADFQGHQVAMAELEAAVVAVQMIEQRDSQIVLATDSMTVKNWLRGESARKAEAVEKVIDLVKLMKERNQRLFVTYINTKFNPADEYTRDSKPTPEKVNAAKELLLEAEKQARLMPWQHTGGVLGGSGEQDDANKRLGIRSGARRNRELVDKKDEQQEDASTVQVISAPSATSAPSVTSAASS